MGRGLERQDALLPPLPGLLLILVCIVRVTWHGYLTILRPQHRFFPRQCGKMPSSLAPIRPYAASSPAFRGLPEPVIQERRMPWTKDPLSQPCATPILGNPPLPGSCQPWSLCPQKWDRPHAPLSRPQHPALTHLPHFPLKLCLWDMSGQGTWFWSYRLRLCPLSVGVGQMWRICFDLLLQLPSLLQPHPGAGRGGLNSRTPSDCTDKRLAPLCYAEV